MPYPHSFLQIEFHDNFTAVVGENMSSFFITDPVVLQAVRFGGQVAWLEDNGFPEDRERIRKAWRNWLRQFEGTDYHNIALGAYYETYCAEERL